MDAFSAKTAAQRASVALERCCRIDGDLGREMCACFEMMDGDDVIAIGLTKLATSARYRAAVLKHAGGSVPTVWVEYARTRAEHAGGDTA